MKLLIEEAESEALVAELIGSSRRLVASWLLHTELHCTAGRNPTIILPDAIATVLDVVNLVDVTRGDFLAAGMHPRCADLMNGPRPACGDVASGRVRRSG